MTVKTKYLLLCGAIGGPLFVTVFLVEGMIRENYDPFRHPISSLAIGDRGWIQITNFILCGLFLIAFTVGLKRALHSLKGSITISRLIGAVGIGLLGTGIFPTDPIYGYPMHLPLAIAQYTLQGHLHDLFSLPVFICLPIACFKFRKILIAAGETGWARYALFSGIAILVFFVLAGIGFKQVEGFVNFAGAFQRLSVITGCTWITLLSIFLLRKREFGLRRLTS